MDYGINNFQDLSQNELYNLYKLQYANQNFGNYAIQNNYPTVQTPSFRGSLETPPDTFTPSTQLQTEKKGMSTGAKWGLGGLAVVGLGTLAYVLSKGRIGANETKKLAEHIEFKPAKTIEEAKKFAKDKFGVVYLDDLGKFEDVEIANFINEWITKTHNNPKLGPKTYPKLIVNDNRSGGFMSMTKEITDKNGKNQGCCLGVNLDFIKNFENTTLKKWKNTQNIFFLSKDKNGKYSILNSQLENEYTKRVANFLNADKLNFKEKMQLILDLNSYNDLRIVNGVIEIRTRNLDNFLNHEQGHLLHRKICPTFEQMKKVTEFEKKGEKVSDITREFLENEDIQKTVSKVSKYSKESPLEFVAETFAGLCDDKKFDDDVMALYKKYGGPVV